jgi:hypothetical protein
MRKNSFIATRSSLRRNKWGMSASPALQAGQSMVEEEQAQEQEQPEGEEVHDEVLRAFLEEGQQMWEDLQARIRAMDAEEGALR